MHCKTCDVEWSHLTAGTLCWHCGEIGDPGRAMPPWSNPQYFVAYYVKPRSRDPYMPENFVL